VILTATTLLGLSFFFHGNGMASAVKVTPGTPSSRSPGCVGLCRGRLRARAHPRLLSPADKTISWSKERPSASRHYRRPLRCAKANRSKQYTNDE
jgi:hypothetical protein